MTVYYRRVDQEIQTSEVTTAHRRVLVEVGTSEVKTVTISQDSAAFTQASGSVTVIEAELFAVTLATGDLTTEGQLAIKLEGSTDTDYVLGVSIVGHDPYDDIATITTEMHIARQGVAGMTVTDLADNSLTIYDTDGLTSLVKLLRTVDGTQTSWIPTDV